MYNRSLKTFHDAYLGLYLLAWFVLYSSGQVATSPALSRLHIQLCFLNKKFQGGGYRVVAQGRINVCEKEKTTVTLISFQCTLFELTKKYICLLKIVKNSGHKL